ncbi:hypothetical protein [Paenibacillus xylanexedens]|uniref:Uncharacterized protein n=1 Tax=Paenibacillus xylanexedens TaxID=528191 RepID=A0ABS4RNJ0_PAEXY|nr:hypothetical protein [Paenibacillus xylanexedens]MBP2243854.1 hypothetical protein [Paenibacillus xylanexedens]
MKWLKRMSSLLLAGSLLTGSLGVGTEVSAAGAYTAVADPSKQYQTMEGWGTSLRSRDKALIYIGFIMNNSS